MKKYCNMSGRTCLDTFSIPENLELKDCIYPTLLPLYENNLVPSYVQSMWKVDDEGHWYDRVGVRWTENGPSGPTPDDPNYTGPWPIAEEQPEEPSDTPEE